MNANTDAELTFGSDGSLSTLTAEVWLPRPRGQVFPFFADAGNLDALTPPWLRFEIVTPQPIEMRVGARIDYRLRLRGLPVRWTSEITAWEPGRRFVDEQRRGPYRAWIHEHTFLDADDGTIVRDFVKYAAPGGPWVDRLFVRRDVRAIFTYRQQKLAELFP